MNHQRISTLPFLLVFLAGIALLCSVDANEMERSPTVELLGIARFPADRFVDGPVSGQFILARKDAPYASMLPFSLGQPIQGFSASVDEGNGRFLVLPDNGFGSKQNSADFVLRLYRIRPDFKTIMGGTGLIDIESSILLRDPFSRTPFERIADRDYVSFKEHDIAVSPLVRSKFLLTGGDYDPESLQLMDDGSFWIGEEFGPWLLHFDRVGRLLDPPFSLPSVSSPDNPMLDGQEALAASSGGFEGMALDKNQQRLYPMLEKPLANQPGQLLIYNFDLKQKRFDEKATMRYPLDEGATAVGAIQSMGEGRFVVVERDSQEGPAARIKRVYRIDEKVTDEKGVLRKKLVADLLAIHDPANLAADHSDSTNAIYRYAFHTIESLVIMGKDKLGLINDNNYPFGNGPGGEVDDGPEETVFIMIKVPELSN